MINIILSIKMKNNWKQKGADVANEPIGLKKIRNFFRKSTFLKRNYYKKGQIKMRKWLTIVFWAGCCCINADYKLAINGEFNNPEKGVPAQWLMNTALSGEIKITQEDTQNVVTLTSTVKPAHVFSNICTPVIAGDKITISVKVNGTGKAVIGVYQYDKGSHYLGVIKLHTFAVEPDWKTAQFAFYLEDFKEKKLGFVRVVFGIEKKSSVSFANLEATKSSPGVNKEVSNAQAASDAPATNSKIVDIPFSLVLPEAIYAVPGVKTAIYLDNIIITQTPEKYALKIEPAIGEVTDGAWTLTPVNAQVGEHALNICVVDKKSGTTIAASKVRLNVASPTAGEGKKMNLLVIGDSLTGASQYPQELFRLLSKKGNPQCYMLGTQKKADGVAHEGYGGWAWNTFITKYNDKPVKRPSDDSSPFIFLDAQGKPNMDIPRYFKKKCQGVKPDVITILLGINDCFYLSKKLDDMNSVNAGIDSVFSNSEILIKALQKAAPNAIICICLTPPPNRHQTAFEANYKDRYSRWEWRQLQHILVQRQIKYFGNREKDDIYIIPTELNIDCNNGYPENNAVHPNKKGYDQLAATIYSCLKWQLYTGKLLK